MPKTQNFEVAYYRSSDYARAVDTNRDVPLYSVDVQAVDESEAILKTARQGRELYACNLIKRGKRVPLPASFVVLPSEVAAQAQPQKQKAIEDAATPIPAHHTVSLHEPVHGERRSNVDAAHAAELTLEGKVPTSSEVPAESLAEYFNPTLPDTTSGSDVMEVIHGLAPDPLEEDTSPLEVIDVPLDPLGKMLDDLIEVEEVEEATQAEDVASIDTAQTTEDSSFGSDPEDASEEVEADEVAATPRFLIYLTSGTSDADEEEVTPAVPPSEDPLTEEEKENKRIRQLALVDASIQKRVQGMATLATEIQDASRLLKEAESLVSRVVEEANGARKRLVVHDHLKRDHGSDVYLSAFQADRLADFFKARIYVGKDFASLEQAEMDVDRLTDHRLDMEIELEELQYLRDFLDPPAPVEEVEVSEIEGASPVAVAPAEVVETIQKPALSQETETKANPATHSVAFELNGDNFHLVLAWIFLLFFGIWMHIQHFSTPAAVAAWVLILGSSFGIAAQLKKLEKK